MKKLLVITNHSYMLWRFRKDLLQAMQEEYDVVISTPFVGHEADFRELGFRMIETRLERRSINPLGELRLLYTYDKMIKEEAPDLVITYSVKPNIYAGWLCRILHVPYVVNVQGLGTAFQKKGMAALVIGLYRAALRKAKVVFFENEENAAIFREKGIVPQSVQKVLPGAGICLEEYPLRYYPQEEKVHFLYLGRIMREKGMDELLSAVKRLWESYRGEFVLDLVGFFEEEYREQIAELEAAGVCVFHGFQEDPRPYYGQAHCVVLPSYHEGLSNVLLEAASVGRPIITSDIPGCRETVDSGRSGLLCRVKDAEALYQQMKAFMDLSYEQRREMGLAGRKLVSEKFEKQMVVEMTVSEIRKGLGGQE